MNGYDLASAQSEYDNAAPDEGLSELEKALYAESDALADDAVRSAGLPKGMSRADAMKLIREGMGEVVTKQRKQHHAMSEETRAELLSEIEAKDKNNGDIQC